MVTLKTIYIESINNKHTSLKIDSLSETFFFCIILIATGFKVSL